MRPAEVAELRMESNEDTIPVGRAMRTGHSTTPGIPGNVMGLAEDMESEGHDIDGDSDRSVCRHFGGYRYLCEMNRVWYSRQR
jgi:hypothetical protein